MRNHFRCSRRSFLAGASALGTVCAMGQPCEPRKNFYESPLDDDLVLVLAGLPKTGERLAAAKTYLDTLAASVLKMRPLPARCLVIGGLSDELFDALRPLRKSGMGVFSDSGLVAALRADFLLVGGTDANALSQVSSEKGRPLFVCADFAPNSALAAAVLRLPNVQGLLDGHAHRWRSSIVPAAAGRAIHTLSLPSAGGTGDIGHVLLRLTDTGATAELHQADFLPPTSAAEAHPADWSTVVAANQGVRCRFVFKS